MNIGILGGTFNPPHNGHVAAAQYAQKQLDLHRLFLIPNNQPPHKQLPHPTASTRQRLEMTRIMAREELPFARVSEIEINRGGPSYTSIRWSSCGKAIPTASFISSSAPTCS